MYEAPIVRVQLIRDSGVSMKDCKVSGSESIAPALIERFGMSDREQMIVVHLNINNVVLSIEVAHMGTLNASIVSTREIFKGAILANAASILIAHNHPSGNLSPSYEDIEITKKIVKAGEILDIKVLDHLIISGSGYTSLNREGMMLGRTAL